MSEPLDEETETTWIEFMNRFDTEIYPVIFKDRGYTKDVAMIIWTLNKYGNDLADVLEELKNKI